MIWQYRKDLFEKYGDRMKQDLGFDPTPSDDSTWEQFYKTSKWFKENAQDDVPYGHGHQAKQHDSLMNDFSNVLWAYGGDYFKDGDNVGRLGSSDPGEPVLDSDEAIEAADFYRQLVSIAHPGSLGLGLGRARRCVRRRPDGDGRQLARVRLRQRDRASSRARSATRASRRAPSAAPACTAAPGIGINATASEHEQKAAWLFVNWATSQADAARRTSRARSAAARRRATRSTSCPRSRRPKKPPSKMPNILTADAVFEAWKPENIGLRPEDRRLERVRHGDLHAALEDARGPAGAGEVHGQRQRTASRRRSTTPTR